MSNQQQPHFDILRIYTKNISLECPNSPQVFMEQGQPEIGIQLSNETQALGDDQHEVALRITVTAKVEEKVLFLVEVEQAGIFTLKGFEEEQLSHMRGAFCPNIIFPYAREIIDNLVRRAGFPPIILAPIDFNAIYAERLAQTDAAEEPKVDA